MFTYFRGLVSLVEMFGILNAVQSRKTNKGLMHYSDNYYRTLYAVFYF